MVAALNFLYLAQCQVKARLWTWPVSPLVRLVLWLLYGGVLVTLSPVVLLYATCRDLPQVVKGPPYAPTVEPPKKEAS